MPHAPRQASCNILQSMLQAVTMLLAALHVPSYSLLSLQPSDLQRPKELLVHCHIERSSMPGADQRGCMVRCNCGLCITLKGLIEVAAAEANCRGDEAGLCIGLVSILALDQRLLAVFSGHYSIFPLLLHLS